VLNAMLPWRMNAAYWHVIHDWPARNREEPPQTIDERALNRLGAHIAAQNGGPPASLYLAVRAARRAVADNPSVPGPYLLLAQAYSLLGNRTRERTATRRVLPHVELIRQTQVVYALNEALRLKPTAAMAQWAHLLLAEAYGADPSNTYFELRVRHLKEYLRYSRQLKSLVRVPPERFTERYKELEKHLKGLDRELKNKQDQYEVNAANKPVLQKARTAAQHGLAETAVKLLMQADVKELSDKGNPRVRTGATLLLYLLLGMGRLEEVREALEPEMFHLRFDKDSLGEHPIGLRAYEWFQIQLAAGCGDYARADREFAELLKLRSRNNPVVYPLLASLDILPYKKAVQKTGSVSDLLALATGHLLLQEATQAAGLPWQIQRHLPVTLQPPYYLRRWPGPLAALQQASRSAMSLLVQEAELRTLRGWLALEAGDTETATRELRLAQERLTVPGRPGGGRAILLSRSGGLTQVCLDLLAGKD
jgi:hypothetical protein